MANNSYLKNEYRSNFNPGKTLPRISTDLDSVRSYQFEVRFSEVPTFISDAAATISPNSTNAIIGPLGAASQTGAANAMTTAAKQVSPIGGAVDDIVVDRLNDKVYYPGKFTPENVTITFDNQLLSRSTPAVYQWFTSIYNPLTGDMMKNAAPGGPGNRSFKCSKMTVLELDNTNEPHAFIEMYGVYPTAVRFSEKNYATNDFSTVEVTFRFDFLDYNKGVSR
tara:strand:+ start:125 stop:793 length:669 start_codon:yes stop_codon:yes gene_type:complete